MLAAPWFSFCTGRRVQHIHKANVSLRLSQDLTIASLCYDQVSSQWAPLFFVRVSFIFHFSLAVFNTPSWWLMNISILMAACFPTTSYHILMSHDSTVQAKLCLVKKYKILYNYQKNVNYMVLQHSVYSLISQNPNHYFKVVIYKTVVCLRQTELLSQ